MKAIYKNFVILITCLVCFSCTEEEMISPNPDFKLSFQQAGNTNAEAGTAFYIIPTGSGEFITLYDGTTGHVWGESGAKGIDFNKADSVAVSYLAAGKYKLTLVASSTGNFGDEFSRSVKTVEVNVVDKRNSFTVFNINGIDGAITKDNEILFSVPSSVVNFNFVPVYGLQSDLSKVYVNGVEQISDTTSNDFSQPVVYTVKAAEGNEKTYTVKISTFPASSEKILSKLNFGIGGNGEAGVIDEENKTITITSNYATNLSAVRLIVASSYGSKVLVGTGAYSDRKNYNLGPTGIKTVKVVAQDNSEVEYKLNVVLDNPVSAFTFEGLVPAPAGIIDPVAKTITVDVLKGTDITQLVAKWAGSVGKVTIGTVNQVNGVTANDFSKPIAYTFYKGSTAGDKYTITVNVK
ncbi:MAG TPA: hypothetical protein VFG54_18340 [Prolixibacteraceae bacterium]|nr:hypothetical protein [Prolixibacteraceae bacterium]